MKKITSAAVLSGALALAAPGLASAHDASAAPGGSAGTTSAASRSGYTPGSADAAQNARLQAQLTKALGQKGPAAAPAAAAATVYYSTASAPTFRTEIRQGAANWNNSVTSVKLVEDSTRATLTYREGNDPRGSYYSGNGHGGGLIFLDIQQMGVYAKVRVTAHETGHALGLPDHYSGPCSELMSGGGPGPSCTNALPNSQERRKVNRIWANGFAVAPSKTITTNTLGAAAFH